MIGIAIVTHGKLGVELIKTAEGIVGSLEKVKAVSSIPSDTLDEIMRKVCEAIEEVDTGEGVILLTDLFGGSSSTTCAALGNNRNLKVISGVNLPMLIDLAFHRNQHNLSEVAALAKKAGQRAIVDVCEVLAKRMKET
ncbi:MAG: PTS sugar transporter subunit IIA [bacterium]